VNRVRWALVIWVGLWLDLLGAEPRLLEQADLPSDTGVVRRLELSTDAGARSLLAVTLVPGAFSVRLLDQSPTFPVGARTVAQSRQVVPGAVAAITGGYFAPDFQPSGLLIRDGRQVRPLGQEGVLSGVVALDAEGQLQLMPRESALDGVQNAVQAGPFLIDPGGAVGVNVRAAVAPRTVVALDDHGRLLLLATGPLTLHQVATLLHDHPQALGMERVERALNLDGGPSTGLSVVLEDPRWSVVERGPVRNVLVLVPRTVAP
jgi:uncharacterized protein YigE (DUF2233 family)